MSTDQLISDDLAALAADNRLRIPALDVTLRALAPARPAAAPATLDVALLATSRVYVRRFARAACGAVALTCALALVAWLSNPLGLSMEMSQFGSALEQYIVYIGPLEVTSWSALVVLMTYVAASRIAERRIASSVAASPADVLPALRARARSLSGVATALRVAGTAALVITIALAWFGNGLDSYCAFWDDGDGVLGTLHAAIVAALLGTLVSAAAAGILARHTRAAERLAHPIVTAAGVALGLATVVTGSRLDVGPRFVTFAGGLVPSTALRIVLTITGSLAVLLVVASSALRRDRREQQSLR